MNELALGEPAPDSLRRRCTTPSRAKRSSAPRGPTPSPTSISLTCFVDPAIPNYSQEPAWNGQRVVTFLIYLNDDYEGGETAFPSLGFSHKGRRGQGLFFVKALADMPPDLRMVHAGRPPTSGEKWVVSQFFRSRPMSGDAS